MSITLNEEQREQFGGMQAQYQGLRKQLTSVAAQVAVRNFPLRPLESALLTHRRCADEPG